MIAQKPIDYGYYDSSNFESSFSRYFTIEKKKSIAGSHRTLYLMKKR